MATIKLVLNASQFIVLLSAKMLLENSIIKITIKAPLILDEYLMAFPFTLMVFGLVTTIDESFR